MRALTASRFWQKQKQNGNKNEITMELTENRSARSYRTKEL